MAPAFGESLMTALVPGSCSLGGLDKVLSTCLWLIPNRFTSHELAAEACQCVLGLIRVCYDGITHDQAKNNFTWAVAIKLIKQVEVLYEMRASHLASLGKCNVYSSMAGLEFLKLFVRLFLFNSSNHALTTLLSSSATAPQMECSRDPDYVFGAFRCLSASRLSLSWNEINDVQDSAHDSTSTTSLVEDKDDENALDGFLPWWDDVRPAEEMEDEEDASAQKDSSVFCYKAGQTMLLIGEMLYLIRPVICVFALRKYGSRSWKPWLISLGMDVCSRFLLSRGESIMKYTGVNKSSELSIQDQLLSYLTMVRNFQWNPIEKKEMKRRKTLFLIYLMRSPIFEIITKPGLDSTQKLVSCIPVLGKAIGKALELLYGVQRYYVYTSGNW